MSIRSFPALLLALTCLTPVTAMAQSMPGHSVDTSVIARYLEANPAPAVSNAPVTPDSLPSGVALAVANVHDANSVATDVVATVGTCDAYFAKSQFLTTSLQPTFEAMSKQDIARAASTLPLLEALLAEIPATEIKAEVCDGNHVNAYTAYQYFALNAARAGGADIGFPPALPIVKQPDLSQAALPFAVGWIKFEQKDFAGAMTAYKKGLAMYPHDHALENEVLATLMQQADGQGMVDYSDHLIASTFDYSDEDRAKIFAARATGSLMLGNLKDCDAALSVSLRYHYDANIAALEAKVRAAIK